MERMTTMDVKEILAHCDHTLLKLSLIHISEPTRH